jgi:signal transduction histidine kinase
LKIIKLNEPDAAAKNVSITLSAPDIKVRFDKNRFSQVIMNLLANAVSYAKEGSEILIEVKETGGSAKISVQNEGEDISDDELDRIWDRYYRGSAANTPGTGFGLSIVKGIMDIHQSAYGVQSENGSTVFWFMTQKT